MSVSQNDVIRVLKKDVSNIYYDEKTNMVVNTKTNEDICSLEYYTNIIRVNMNCSFKGLYSDPCSLLNVIECTECGTVIFTYDNYEDYDDNLKCPTCSDYKTNYDYWTKEDIENDIRKQNTLKMYKDWNDRCDFTYKRQRVKKLKDDEIFKYEIKKDKYSIFFKIGVLGYYDSKVRGLHFKWELKDKGEYFPRKSIVIPLGFTYTYVMWIYPLFNTVKSYSKHYLNILLSKKIKNKEIVNNDENN